MPAFLPSEKKEGSPEPDRTLSQRWIRGCGIFFLLSQQFSPFKKLKTANGLAASSLIHLAWRLGGQIFILHLRLDSVLLSNITEGLTGCLFICYVPRDYSPKRERSLLFNLVTVSTFSS